MLVTMATAHVSFDMEFWGIDSDDPHAVTDTPQQMPDLVSRIVSIFDNRFFSDT